MVRRSKRNYCCVYGCLNSGLKKAEISFFKLPADVERRTKWLELISREDLADTLHRSHCVCEEHFTPQDILSSSHRKKLKNNALPSLRLHELHEEPKFKDETTQTDTSLDSNAGSSTSGIPQKRSVESELSVSSKKIKIEPGNETDTFFSLCDRLLSQELAEFVKTQIHLAFESQGNACHQVFFSNLYHTSPQAYRLLQNVMSLPNPAIFDKQKTPATTTINDRLMLILKNKVEAMTDKEKNCSIVVGTMKLKTNLFYDIKEDKIAGFQEINGIQTLEPADNVLVVMARGLISNWKQPVGFALLSPAPNDDDVTRWIDKILKKLFAMGLNIRTFVSDTFDAAEKRSVTAERPYFLINGSKVYYILDARYLMTEMRDNLVAYDFQFQDREVKYDHIIEFYEHDKQKKTRIAHKLTHSHIYPTDEEKMEIRYAAQLFSNTVATGILTYIDFNAMPESARGTAEFISDVNKLHDALNSCNCRDEVSSITCLNEMLYLFCSEGDDVTAMPSFIRGFQITITSTLMLLHDLKSEGYGFCATRRFNREVLDQLFTRMLRITSSTSIPTTRKFISGFRKLCSSNIVSPRKLTCSYAFSEILTWSNFTFSELDVDNESFVEEKPKIGNVGLPVEQSESDIMILSSDYNQLKLHQSNTLLKVCSHLLEKSCQHHRECPTLRSYITRCTHRSEETLESVQVSPSDEFVQNVKKMDEIFCHCFRRSLNGKISQIMYEEMENITFAWPCSCFPEIFLKKLFIRMRIFYTVKSNNIALRRQKQFSLNILR